jgi:ketosteroid isomerase-like protein
MSSIAGILDDFNAAFNRNDLDAVMTFFADTARYEPGDGTVHVGRAAIRRAFEPQFAGAFGAMRFATEDRVIDERERKAAIRWICHHDTRGDHGKHVALPLRAMLKLRYGGRAQWRGLDVFHLDDALRITGKFTYAGYTRPRLERSP